MRVDAFALELRPRSAWEAMDLGVRLVQVHAPVVWRCFIPVWAAVVVLAGLSMELAPWLPALLLFWFKPWLDRSLLFVLSRSVFGQSSRFADLWQAQSQVWWGNMLRSLLWRRWSPWRAYTQPIEQLEGQKGSARRQRRRLLLRGKRGSAGMMQLAFAQVEMVLNLGAIALMVLLAPEGSRASVLQWFGYADTATGSSLAQWLTFGIYACVVLALEPFYVAAGFCLYLNRRVELEAWDVEQEFRRAFVG